MNLYKMKENSNAVSYPRTLYSIIVSVGLLAMFVTFASWVLLSYPISTAVRNYFYGVNGIGDMSSQASWQYTIPSEVNNTEKSIVDLQPLKDRDGADENREDENKKSAEEKPREVRNNEKITPGISWKNTTPSEASSSENATAVIKENLDEQHSKDAGAVVLNQENKVKQMATDGKGDQPISEATNKQDTADKNPPPPVKGECDLFHGEWFYDESGPLYTNNSCPIITQMQNCQGNGRPDKGYESWRWRPSHCELPRFDGKKFLELMSGKTLAFVGDSVARNQMESLLCILWQVEVPKNRGNRHMQRWYFRSKSVMIVRIWSSWLVNQTGAAFKDIPDGVTKVFLDVPDATFMEYVPEFDVLVLSSGHWFAKQSVYIKNNEIVGTQLWSPPNGQQYEVNNVEALRISSETAIAALAMHPNFTGIAILRSFSPDHYEGGAWNTGGSCTGKVEPARPGHLVENGFTNVMHEKQVAGFNLGTKKQTNGSKLRLMDITEVFSYRHDGHPGPYRSTDPNKITKRGPNGRPPPQDCLHWCMPGPVDTWNELVLEIIRREYEK